MRKNLWALGSRSISGQYRRIMSAGDLNIEDSDVLKLYSAGDIDIKNSSVKKLRAAGDVRAVNVSFDNVSAIGDIVLKGETKADVFVACGNITSEFLSCKVLRNFAKSTKMIRGGSALNGRMSGFFKAETFENFTDTSMEFEYEFKNIINKCRLSAAGPLECERLFSFGELSAKEINADFIYIRPFSSSSVDSIAGSEIIISGDFKQNKLFKSIPKSVNLSYYDSTLSRQPSIMNVKSLEADRISVDHLKADIISGEEVVIGDLCIVERVEYSKSIKISPKAVVNEEVRV